MPAVSVEQLLFSLDGVRPGLVAEVSHNSWLPAVYPLHSDHITWAEWHEGCGVLVIIGLLANLYPFEGVMSIDYFGLFGAEGMTHKKLCRGILKTSYWCVTVLQ